jgi:hypothetical protein
LEITGVDDDNTVVHNYNRNTEVNWDNNALENTQENCSTIENSNTLENTETSITQEPQENNEITEEQYDDDDKVSIENESPEYTYVTINDINTVTRNACRALNVNPESGMETITQQTTTYRPYNLRTKPNKEIENTL